MTSADAKKQCFVISPIGEDGTPVRAMADKVLKHLIRKALGAEYQITRADEDSNPGCITARMVASILEADLIVADLSGANPNVFYEVAIAHGFRKPTVHIQTAADDLPFDVKDMRTVKYDIADPDELERAQRLLRDYAATADREADKLVTPLSAAQRFVSVSTSADPIAESNVQVLEALESLSNDVRQLSRRVVPRTRPAAPRPPARDDKGDRDALTTIIGRVMKAGRMEVDDWRHVVSDDTSRGFDNWAKKCLFALMGNDDEQAANEVLLHPEATFMDQDEEGPDEP